MNKFLLLVIILFVLIFISPKISCPIKNHMISDYNSEYFKTLNINMNMNNTSNQNNPNVVTPYYGPWYSGLWNYGYWNNYLPWNWFYPRYY
jgi:hypothetical protein